MPRVNAADSIRISGSRGSFMPIVTRTNPLSYRADQLSDLKHRGT
jgi:hypothetical protein